MNRILNTNQDCRHSKEKREKLKKFASRHRKKDSIDMGRKLNISIIIKNKYYINETGHQCWKNITTTWLNETASGDTVKAYGQTESLKIDFEGITCEIEFLVTNLKSVDILLGYNRFEKTGVLLDPKNKTFQILPQTRK